MTCIDFGGHHYIEDMFYLSVKCVLISETK